MQGQSQMTGDISHMGLTPQLASMLLSQTNPARGVGMEAWNGSKAFTQAPEPQPLNDQLPMNGNNQQMTQLEILQAISQIGLDNVPPDLLQQLKGSLGEGPLANLLRQPQTQLPANLSFGTLPTPGAPNLSRMNLESQDQNGYNDNFRSAASAAKDLLTALRCLLM